MKIDGIPTVTLNVTIRLSEEEASALDALFGYSLESFISTFYEKMGRAYLEPHEAGLRSLHATCRDQLSGWLSRARMARSAFNGMGDQKK